MSRPHVTEAWRWNTAKLLPRHRESTMQQVLEHQESTYLQYGLVRWAVAWG
jgi:hypothetical protein